jgi:hypothetical protein
MNNPEQTLAVRSVTGITTHCMGKLSQSREAHEYVIRNHRFDPDRSRARPYVTDLGAVSRTYLATTLWVLGLPEQALKMSADAMTHARATAHPYSLATTLAWTARLHQLRRDTAHTLSVAEETVAVGKEFGFPIPRALGTLLHSWARAEQGDAQAVEHMSAAIDAYRKMGVGTSRPYYTALLAEQRARRGRIEEAVTMIAGAVSESMAQSAHAEEPEIRRIECEILRLRGRGEASACERRLREALALAERQGALAWRLRTAMSLARLLRDEGRRQEAHEQLRAERVRFTEGFGTDDLKAADALLGELA